MPTSFDGFPAIPAPSEIPVAEVATLGTVRAAWNGVDQVTAMALSADGDVVFVQWKLDEHGAGTANAEVTVNTGFGQGGVLRVRFPAGTRLGDIAYDLGAYYFTVQLPDGDDSLLRLVYGSADGGS